MCFPLHHFFWHICLQWTSVRSLLGTRNMFTTSYRCNISWTQLFSNPITQFERVCLFVAGLVLGACWTHIILRSRWNCHLALQLLKQLEIQNPSQRQLFPWSEHKVSIFAKLHFWSAASGKMMGAFCCHTLKNLSSWWHLTLTGSLYIYRGIIHMYIYIYMYYFKRTSHFKQGYIYI